jgi:DNA-binding transcriptional LysR family regulator
MTLQQLKYAIAVAEKGSVSNAAKSMFVSQPSLSNSIRALEEEIEITIFTRSNKGINITNDGIEFLGYARQVLAQSNILEDKYLNHTCRKQKFCISTQHYPFAANAFVELVKEFGGDEYEFTLRETKTYEIIQDVKNLKSELGLIYLSNYNESVLRKLLKESQLVFSALFTVKPHVFICREHPLAAQKSISLDDLEEYPCISFEQGENNSFYFSEEILSVRSVKKSIKVSDRAAVVNFMIGLNGYTISSGVYPKYLHSQEIISVPLDVDEKITVGVIQHKNTMPTKLGTIYLKALKDIAMNIRCGK